MFTILSNVVLNRTRQGKLRTPARSNAKHGSVYCVDMLKSCVCVLKALFCCPGNFLPVREYYACMPRTKSFFVEMGVQCSISGKLVNDFCRCVKVMCSRFLARPLSHCQPEDSEQEYNESKSCFYTLRWRRSHNHEQFCYLISKCKVIANVGETGHGIPF